MRGLTLASKKRQDLGAVGSLSHAKTMAGSTVVLEVTVQVKVTVAPC